MQDLLMSQYIESMKDRHSIDASDHKNITVATAIYISFFQNTFTLPAHRLTVQTIFLTVNTICSSVIGYTLLNYKNLITNFSILNKVLYFSLPYFIILTFCYIWFKILDEYEVLSNSFIMLTKSMEQNLPVRPLTLLFDVNKDHDINHSLGTLGKSLPVLFSILYMIMFIYLLSS